MSSSAHLSYLHQVTKAVAKSRSASAAVRGRAIQQGRRAVAMGADVATVAVSIPSPSTLAAVLTPPVIQAATTAFQLPTNPAPNAAVQVGISAATKAPSGPALDAERASQPPATLPAFDAGVALVHGAAKAAGVTPGLGPQHTAGWLITHGLVGAPSTVKMPVVQAIMGAPGINAGAITAVSGIVKGYGPSQQAGNVVANLKGMAAKLDSVAKRATAAYKSELAAISAALRGGDSAGAGTQIVDIMTKVNADPGAGAWKDALLAELQTLQSAVQSAAPTAAKSTVKAATKAVKAHVSKAASIIKGAFTDTAVEDVEVGTWAVLVGSAFLAAGMAGTVGYLLMKKWTLLWIGFGLTGAGAAALWVTMPKPGDANFESLRSSLEGGIKITQGSAMPKGLGAGPHATAATAGPAATATAGAAASAAPSGTSSSGGAGAVGPHAAAAAGGVSTPATSAAG